MQRCDCLARAMQSFRNASFYVHKEHILAAAKRTATVLTRIPWDLKLQVHRCRFQAVGNSPDAFAYALTIPCTGVEDVDAQATSQLRAALDAFDEGVFEYHNRAAAQAAGGPQADAGFKGAGGRGQRRTRREQAYASRIPEDRQFFRPVEVQSAEWAVFKPHLWLRGRQVPATEPAPHSHPYAHMHTPPPSPPPLSTGSPGGEHRPAAAGVSSSSGGAAAAAAKGGSRAVTAAAATTASGELAVFGSKIRLTPPPAGLSGTQEEVLASDGTFEETFVVQHDEWEAHVPAHLRRRRERPRDEKAVAIGLPPVEPKSAVLYDIAETLLPELWTRLAPLLAPFLSRLETERRNQPDDGGGGVRASSAFRGAGGGGGEFEIITFSSESPSDNAKLAADSTTAASGGGGRTPPPGPPPVLPRDLLPLDSALAPPPLPRGALLQQRPSVPPVAPLILGGAPSLSPLTSPSHSHSHSRSTSVSQAPLRCSYSGEFAAAAAAIAAAAAQPQLAPLTQPPLAPLHVPNATGFGSSSPQTSQKTLVGATAAPFQLTHGSHGSPAAAPPPLAASCSSGSPYLVAHQLLGSSSAGQSPSPSHGQQNPYQHPHSHSYTHTSQVHTATSLPAGSTVAAAGDALMLVGLVPLRATASTGTGAPALHHHQHQHQHQSQHYPSPQPSQLQHQNQQQQQQLQQPLQSAAIPPVNQQQPLPRRVPSLSVMSVQPPYAALSASSSSPGAANSGGTQASSSSGPYGEVPWYMYSTINHHHHHHHHHHHNNNNPAGPSPVAVLAQHSRFIAVQGTVVPGAGGGCGGSPPRTRQTSLGGGLTPAAGAAAAAASTASPAGPAAAGGVSSTSGGTAAIAGGGGGRGGGGASAVARSRAPSTVANAAVGAVAHHSVHLAPLAAAAATVGSAAAPQLVRQQQQQHQVSHVQPPGLASRKTSSDLAAPPQQQFGTSATAGTAAAAAGVVYPSESSVESASVISRNRFVFMQSSGCNEPWPPWGPVQETTTSFSSPPPPPASVTTNVAFGKPAFSSSVYMGQDAYGPSRAVDGVADHTSMYISRFGDVNPWLSVDLGEAFIVSRIVLSLREDCCGNETCRAEITYNSLAYKMPGSGVTGGFLDITVSPPLIGRFVTVQNFNPAVNTSRLAVSELLVYGYPAEPQNDIKAKTQNEKQRGKLASSQLTQSHTHVAAMPPEGAADFDRVWEGGLRRCIMDETNLLTNAVRLKMPYGRVAHLPPGGTAGVPFGVIEAFAGWSANSAALHGNCLGFGVRASCSILQYGAGYGDDIRALKTLILPDEGACCEACYTAPDCMFWDYQHSSKTCRLKDNEGALVPPGHIYPGFWRDDGRVAGAKRVVSTFKRHNGLVFTPDNITKWIWSRPDALFNPQPTDAVYYFARSLYLPAALSGVQVRIVVDDNVTVIVNDQVWPPSAFWPNIANITVNFAAGYNLVLLRCYNRLSYAAGAAAFWAPNGTPPVPPPPHLKSDCYVGCYMDSADPRVLPIVLLTADNMTIDLCRQLALEAAQLLVGGLSYYGLEAGRQCFGGNDLSQAVSLGASSSCTWSCAGNRRQVCGGDWAVSVYRTIFPPPSPPVPPSPPPHALPLGDFVGCFSDSDPVRSLPALLEVSPANMTVDRCRQLAKEGGFEYFGLESGVECYGGDSLEAAWVNGRSSSCDYACTGNDCQICGGNWAVSIFRTELALADLRKALLLRLGGEGGGETEGEGIRAWIHKRRAHYLISTLLTSNTKTICSFTLPFRTFAASSCRPVYGLLDVPARRQLMHQFEHVKAAWNIEAEERVLRPKSGQRGAARDVMLAEWARREAEAQPPSPSPRS
ncbi:hypothetical protein VOLCADRAFT_97747 [Volvox carteri f. nagariensis]|uniref:WSC domain-containing protein n=1 Tax=Volvox carteri f. nagariensis TaxID=3068 RepID=D8UDJ2_VOLCA|nr:uncharacterized protein VOLCADRAFT_97747 [Volvox carteri f. nagariensis]EFJ42201.1 hypothetical protein VOLCADRAFT_97747 [Volvox carteri f. nagariensis]|eukprot:XP_002956744.1 hypothetical protein VOLCADRAFT_97747 [Volvox carteri f. nagariensis]